MWNEWKRGESLFGEGNRERGEPLKVCRADGGEKGKIEEESVVLNEKKKKGGKFEMVDIDGKKKGEWEKRMMKM